MFIRSILLLLIVSFANANDLFSYSINSNLLFLFNEEKDNYYPGVGIDGVFMAKPVKNFGFGINPAYSVWSLKFEDESVSYRIHSIRMIFFVRPFIPLKNNNNIYFQFGSGLNFMNTHYDREVLPDVTNEYNNFVLTSSLGFQVKHFDCALKFGTFNESNLDVFVWTGLSIGLTW